MFRETEIIRAGEELPAVIDAPRGEQLLGANHTKLFAQFRPNQVLSAVTARHREVRGVIERAIRPKGNQPGVLIIRMRGDVERTAEYIQLLQPEPDGG